MSITIRNDDEGKLDEVLTGPAMHVHLERLDVGLWWLGITTVDGELINIDLQTSRPGKTPITGTVEREG
jgi:hypothetical protein